MNKNSIKIIKITFQRTYKLLSVHPMFAMLRVKNTKKKTKYIVRELKRHNVVGGFSDVGCLGRYALLI